ncbi:DUF1598 domain-containing protein [Novipirellula artificiosorum]|nr:DUF1598 domain-containing protein [Novipirellula artificiosorum]
MSVQRIGQLCLAFCSVLWISSPILLAQSTRSEPVTQDATSNERDPRGGNSMADFQSLMQLIQETVEPTIWQDLGGTSTMAPYPQGVWVNSKDTIQLHQTDELTDLANQAAGVMQPRRTEPADLVAWQQPADLRFVSLRRLANEHAQRKASGTPLSDSILCLAGLSEVKLVFLSDDHDIVLAGSVGGIENHRGWFRDKKTGRSTLRLEFLQACFESAIRQAPFGCTIDPTTDGLQQAASLAVKIRSNDIPVREAPGHLRDAIGMQRVEVFGTAADSMLSYLMVKADRHMKQLALGERAMPEATSNYLDAIDSNLAAGPPHNLLLRLWFTASPHEVLCDPSQHVFFVSGRPVRLSGQNERALATGQRGVLTTDPASDQWVAEFNEHWQSICDEYPMYSALESVFRTAAIAELSRRYATTAPQHSLTNEIAGLGSDRPWTLAVPGQVETMAVLHETRLGRKIHHILVASGGVLVRLGETIPETITIADLGPEVSPGERQREGQDRRIPPQRGGQLEPQRWWWNLGTVTR